MKKAIHSIICLLLLGVLTFVTLQLWSVTTISLPHRVTGINEDTGYAYDELQLLSIEINWGDLLHTWHGRSSDDCLILTTPRDTMFPSGVPVITHKINFPPKLDAEKSSTLAPWRGWAYDSPFPPDSQGEN